MRCIEALGLKVRITGAAGDTVPLAADVDALAAEADTLAADAGSLATEADTLARPVDVEVSLLGEAAWPGEMLEAPERLCYTDADTDEHGTPIVQVWEHGQAFYRLRYFDASEFLLDRTGTRVWARWPPAVSQAEITMCLLGPIIGFVLHLRGAPCLHASAVAVEGRAVAFLGHSGAGKSTTAAAFIRRGFRALTDDVLALDEGKDSGFRIQDSGNRDRGSGIGDQGRLAPSPQPLAPGFYVRPGHNLVRLWPDAVRALYGSEDALPRGTDTTDKRHLDLTAQEGAFQSEALPLAAIYVLADRQPGLAAAASVMDLTGHQALMALVARTYMNYVLDVDLRVRALTVFARLAAQVPIRQLTVRHDAESLGELTDAILGDLATLGRRL